MRLLFSLKGIFILSSLSQRASSDKVAVWVLSMSDDEKMQQAGRCEWKSWLYPGPKLLVFEKKKLRKKKPGFENLIYLQIILYKSSCWMSFRIYGRLIQWAANLNLSRFFSLSTSIPVFPCYLDLVGICLKLETLSSFQPGFQLRSDSVELQPLNLKLDQILVDLYMLIHLNISDFIHFWIGFLKMVALDCSL